MIDFVKNKPIFISLFFLVLLFSLSCYGDAKAGQQGGSSLGKVILVAENSGYSRPIWCGGGELLAYTADWGDISFFNVKTGKSEEIKERSILPIVCTQDGERLIYLDSDGAGREDNTVEPGTLGLWTYEFKTNERRLLTIVYTEEVTPFGESILSPNGKKLYLGKRPKKSVEPIENAPEIIWSDTKRTASSFVWLPDSSGVVKSHWNRELERDVLDISFFTPEKRSITIDPRSHEIFLLPIGEEGALYMKVWDGTSVGAREIQRCALDLENNSASCESVLRRDRDILDFNLSPDGKDFLFTEKGGRCVKMIKGGKAGCVTPPRDIFVYRFNISLDGRWIGYIADDEPFYKPFENAIFLYRLKDEKKN